MCKLGCRHWRLEIESRAKVQGAKYYVNGPGPPIGRRITRNVEVLWKEQSWKELPELQCLLSPDYNGLSVGKLCGELEAPPAQCDGLA